MDRFKVKNRLAPVMSEKGKRIFCGSLSFSFSYATTINENKKRFVLRFARFTLPLHNQTLSESEMKDSVLILSGGVDSTTLLYDEQARIALAISFDYGSKHNAREIPFARMHCERLGIKHITIPLDFMTQYFVSSLLEGGEEIPEGHYADENMKSTVVPFRNGIMLSIAVGIAESNGLKYVMMANHGGDHTIYPDCRPEFVDAFDQAAAAGTFVNVHLRSPYTNITKGDIARRGKALGIDYSETWSCYKGGEHHCGKCGTCVERREAFADAGIEDTTVYDG